MSYVEREADARLAVMRARAEDAEARLAQIAEHLEHCVTFRRGELDGVNVTECMKHLLPALNLSLAREGE